MPADRGSKIYLGSLMKEENGKGKVTVEFFGPFREFGKNLELPVEGELTFDEIINRLEVELGESFRERALKKNTTYILNNQVVEKKVLSVLRISPGDRLAFALIIGGG